MGRSSAIGGRVVWVSRRYYEPVRVRAGAACDGHAPQEFLWRGRWYLVRAVLAHWVEGSAWWRRSHMSAARAADRQVWRVEASAPQSSSAGVYDLCRDPVADQWHLARALD